MRELEIPESWGNARLADVCEKITDGTHFTPKFIGSGIPFVTVTHLTNGKIDFKSASNISLKDFEANKSNCHPKIGDVLFSKDGTVGKVALVDFEKDFIVLSSLAILRPDGRLLGSEFLREFLKSPLALDQAIEKKTGSAIRRIILKNLRLIDIPIPPLGEQRRIVAKIESTFQRIEAIEKAVESAESLLTKYRESLLNKAFRGELVPQDPKDEPAAKLLERIRNEREKNNDGKKKRKAHLPPITDEEIPFEIPASWEWVRLGDAVMGIDAGWSPQCESRPRVGNEWGVLKISAVTWGRFRPDENKALPSSLSPRPENEVRSGDFIISRANTAELVGRGVVVDDCPPRLLLNDKLLRIKFWAGVSCEFFNLINNGFIGRSYYESVASGTSSSMRNITREQINLMVIPLPPSIEQQRIVSSFKAQAEKLNQVAVTLNAAKDQRITLLNSILSSAFSGHLVPQDPSEGTGHQLLEQILTQNTAGEQNQKKEKETKKTGASKKRSK